MGRTLGRIRAQWAEKENIGLTPGWLMQDTDAFNRISERIFAEIRRIGKCAGMQPIQAATRHARGKYLSG